MRNGYIDRLNPESVRLLMEAGFEWQPAIPGFYNRLSETSIRYETVRDAAPGQLAELVRVARYDIDAREWVCEPQGPLRIVTVDLAQLSPDARNKWASHNATARDVLQAIQNRRPVTLRELRNVAGEFVARHQITGLLVTSTVLKRACINPPAATG